MLGKVQLYVHLLQSVGIANTALELESRKKQRDVVREILDLHGNKDIAERVGKRVHRRFRPLTVACVTGHRKPIPQRM